MSTLCVLLLVFSANCALTINDLKWDNERATVDVICDTPTEIHDDVKLFAVHWSTGRIVTDEDPVELRYFSAFADAFFMIRFDGACDELDGGICKASPMNWTRTF